jgi:hypothetical protein
LISEFQDKRGETHIERAARIAKSAAKAAAKSETRRNAAIARKDDPTFRLKVAVADKAKAAEAARAAIAERAARAAETRVRNGPVLGVEKVKSPFHSFFNKKVNTTQYHPNASLALDDIHQGPAARYNNFGPVSFKENPIYRPLGNVNRGNAEQALRQRGLFNAPENEDPAQPFNVNALREGQRRKKEQEQAEEQAEEQAQANLSASATSSQGNKGSWWNPFKSPDPPSQYHSRNGANDLSGELS